MNNILTKGKALLTYNSTIYIARGYKIYRSTNNKNWILDGKVIDTKYTFLSSLSRLLNRILRLEVSTMLLLNDGSRLVSAKKGIFIAKKNSKKYIKTFSIPRGNRPLNICLHPNGSLYFGEYILNGKYKNLNRTEVHIYKSDDNGQTWNICYTFPKDTIRHIHGIFYDHYTDKLWITTGDRDKECMIASTSNEFKNIEIFKQGKQIYRAVSLLFYRDYIIYGTDTEHETNAIYSINRETKEEKKLQELQGSVLMAIKDINSNYALLSTAVEPSKINNHMSSHIWFSRDGIHWHDIYDALKDKWSAKYFQYGRITFPHNPIYNNQILFSGHALKYIENRVVILNKIK